MSDGYETPRWDDPALELDEDEDDREAERTRPAGEAAEGAAEARELESPWARAAREARDAAAPDEAVDADDPDRSSENVLAAWPVDSSVSSRDPVDAHVSPDAPAGPTPGLGEGWVPAPPPAEAEAPLAASEHENVGYELVADDLADAPQAELDVAAPEPDVLTPEPEVGPEVGPEDAPGLPELGSLTAEHAPGDLDVPPGVPLLEGIPRGERRSVGIVVSRFNGQVTTKLLDGALTELADRGVVSEAITVLPVPGAFELPLAAMALAKTRRFSCIVALGCVIRGDTPHFDYVASETASGLQLAAIETGVPVAFGVLTLDRVEQAEARLQKGAEAVRTALEMADIFANLRAAASR